MKLYGLIRPEDSAEICGNIYYVPSVYFDGRWLSSKPFYSDKIVDRSGVVRICYNRKEVVYTGTEEECKDYIYNKMQEAYTEHSDVIEPFCSVGSASNLELLAHDETGDIAIGIDVDDIVWKIHHHDATNPECIFVMHYQNHDCYAFHEDLPEDVLETTQCVEELISNRCVWGPEGNSAEEWAESHAQYRLARRYLDLLAEADSTLDVNTAACFGFAAAKVRTKTTQATVVFIDRVDRVITIQYPGVRLSLHYVEGKKYVVGQEVILSIF